MPPYPSGPPECDQCSPGVETAECVAVFGEQGCVAMIDSFTSASWIILYTVPGLMLLLVGILAIVKKIKADSQQLENFEFQLQSISNVDPSFSSIAIEAAAGVPAGAATTAAAVDVDEEDGFVEVSGKAKKRRSRELPQKDDGEGLGEDEYLLGVEGGEKRSDPGGGGGEQQHQSLGIMKISYSRSTLWETCVLGLIITNWILLFIFVFFVLQIDYYLDCEWKGYDALCFYGTFRIYGSYDANSIAFFILWWALLLYTMILVVLWDSIRNWIRFPASYENATHVRVWVSEDTTPDLGKIGHDSHRPNWAIRCSRKIRQSVKKCRLFHESNGNNDGRAATVKVCSFSPTNPYRHGNMNSVPEKYFIFEGVRYALPRSRRETPTIIRTVLHGKKNRELSVSGLLSNKNTVSIQPISNDDRNNMIEMFGSNEIPIQMPSIPESILAEGFQVFFAYQLVVYAIWVWFSYLVVGICLISIVFFSAGLSIYTKRKDFRRILSLAAHQQNTTCTVLVPGSETKRGSIWVSIPSKHLVVGDIILVQKTSPLDWMVPADLVLLSGSVVVDESRITGEPDPVYKQAFVYDDEDNVSEERPDPSATFSLPEPHHRDSKFRNILRSGSTIVEMSAISTTTPAGIPPIPDGSGIAMVAATGISTSRGELVRRLLYSVSARFKWDEEFLVAIFFLFLYALTAFILSIVFQKRSGGEATWVTIWSFAMFTVLQTVSPLLPNALLTGQESSATRLFKEHRIQCVNLERIPVGGKARVWCFNKRGTLTHRDLEFIGFLPLAVIGPSERGMTSFIGTSRMEDLDPAVQRALATCHDVFLFSEGNRILVGNATDKAMLAASGWELKASQLMSSRSDTEVVRVLVSKRNPAEGHLKIIRHFAFHHTHMAMSVIVENERTKEREIFAKGSPEAIISFCTSSSSSQLRDQITNKARQLGLEGFTILVLATRRLGANENVSELVRGDVESNLTFLGLLAFRSEIKDHTSLHIERARNAGVCSVMLTGDDPYSSLFTAQEAGIVPKKARKFIANLENATSNNCTWSELLTSSNSRRAARASSGDIVRLNFFQSTHDLIRYISEYSSPLEERFVFIVTGPTFEALVRSQWAQDERLFLRIRVFARMLPEQKANVIQHYQVSFGLIVGFLGQGSNDASALKQAHVGIMPIVEHAGSEPNPSPLCSFTMALSTSDKSPVAGVVNTIQEGKCALASSFASYKFLIVSGLICSIINLSSYYFGILLPNLAYLSIDMIAIVPLSIAMVRTKPSVTLDPIRPTSSLFSFLTLGSILGYFIICLAFLLGSFVLMSYSSGYVPWPSHLTSTNEWWLLANNWETTTMYTTTFLQLITAPMVFSAGHFHQGINLPLLLTWIALAFFVSVLLLTGPNNFTNAFHIASFPFNGVNTTDPVWQQYQIQGGLPSPGMSFDLRFKLWVLDVIFIACALGFEFFLVDALSGYIRDWRRQGVTGKWNMIRLLES